MGSRCQKPCPALPTGFCLARALTLGTLCLKFPCVVGVKHRLSDFHGDQRISWHTMGDKTRHEAGS